MKNYILILLIIIIIFYIFDYNFSKENIELEESIGLEENMGFDKIIPLNIYQTWKTKDLPPKMKNCVDRLKKDNPEFNHYLYDDEDCKNFIEENFSQDVIDTYNKLIPGAFKADLWRYCILYINGGIYLDIKYYTISPFKLINFLDKEYFVKDMDNSGGGIYNAFMICKKGNKILKKCIDQIVENVKNNYYGETEFHVTGPLLMKNFFSKEEINKLNVQHGIKKNCPDTYCIYLNNNPILSMYQEYRDDNEQGSIKNNNYHVLWQTRKIYK